MATDIEALNAMIESDASAALLRCCGSNRWVDRMLAARPFSDEATLIELADRIWWGLERSDWLEAFSHHPKIGDIDSLKRRFASTQVWASGEQAGVHEASDETIAALAHGNREYEDRFGYIFIVCATGKSADQMLALLDQRLGNDPSTELRIAAEEQRKITHIRLEKLTR